MEFKEMKILEFIEDLSGDKSSPGVEVQQL